MDPLLIAATEDTPEIKFNPKENIFELSKRSFSENPMAFFKPILDWLEEYSNNPNSVNNFDFKLDYCNTASTKQIAKLLLVLEKLSKKTKVVINWFYEEEDTDILEMGRRYESLIKLSFNFKPVKK